MHERLSMPILVAILFLGAAIMLAGCGSEDSPSDTVQAFADSLNDRDFEAIYQMSSESIRNESTEEEFVGALEAVWIEGTRLEDFEIVSEEIDGDTATVTYKARMVIPEVEGDEEASEQTVLLVKEDGEWKLG